ncbi:hypothetical protein V1525DRAFT_400597 [Lipomyces kononenkoae]|uniref:Uncharacterized protein n=1 Tax=Lipomyces kononenkoae TaxID=34357 RepID=A0ACC3T4J2_LIPKO
MTASHSQSVIEMVAAESATMAFLKAVSPASDLADDCASFSRPESPLDTGEGSSIATSLSCMSSSSSSSSTSLPKMATFTIIPAAKKKQPARARRAVETTCPIRGCLPLPIKGPRSALRHFESLHHREMFDKLLEDSDNDPETSADNSTAATPFDSIVATGTGSVDEHNSANTSNLDNCQDLRYFYNEDHYKYMVWIAETGYHHEFAKTHRNGVRDLIAYDALIASSLEAKN